MSDVLSTGTISVADTRAALAAGAISSSVPAGNSCVTAALSSMPTVGITITPAVSAGSLAIEGSSDGRNFFALSAQASGSTTSALTTTGASFLRCNTSALTLIQVRAVTGTAFGNGPISVSIDAASDAGLVTTIDGASGGGSGGGPATLAAGSVSAGAYVAGAAVDGWNATEGSTTDAAVTTDATGSISARLRGLVNLIAARIPTLGSKNSAGSLPVVIASDQGAIPVTTTPSGTQAVSAASLPLPTGAATAANQATEITSLASLVANTPAKPTTGTPSSVANATSNTVLLALNANRKGATVFNDDTVTTGATLNVALGFTASATAYTYAIPAQGYYEVPFGFSGAINGFASAATGNARITELT